MGARLEKLKAHRAERLSQPVTPYELFLVAVTLLSLVNLVLFLFIKNPELLFTIGIIELVISALFFVDFLRLFFTAKSKLSYFFGDFGWADLLSSVPYSQLNIFRIFRLIKAYGVFKRAGLQGIQKGLNENRASAALLLVVFTIILLLEFGSVGILFLESSNPTANITSASDALWWVVVTIATVGYGDQYPVTNAGRTFATFVMFIGVGLFGVVTGFLANKFLPASNNAKSDPVAINKDATIAQMHEELKEIKALLATKQEAPKQPRKATAKRSK